jgi:hypothetical protein
VPAGPRPGRRVLARAGEFPFEDRRRQFLEGQFVGLLGEDVEDDLPPLVGQQSVTFALREFGVIPSFQPVFQLCLAHCRCSRHPAVSSCIDRGVVPG